MTEKVENTKPTAVGMETDSLAKTEQKYRLVVHKSETDKSQNIQVGVNGIIYAIKRGAEVIVPVSVVEALRNAVRTVYVQEGNEVIASEIPAYPFSANPI